MKHLNLQPGESIVMDEKALIRTSKLMFKPGILVLTDRRLVFINKADLFAILISGLGGWLATRAKTRVPLDTPLPAITGVQQTKFGRNEMTNEVILTCAVTG